MLFLLAAGRNPGGLTTHPSMKIYQVGAHCVESRVYARLLVCVESLASSSTSVMISACLTVDVCDGCRPGEVRSILRKRTLAASACGDERH